MGCCTRGCCTLKRSCGVPCCMRSAFAGLGTRRLSSRPHRRRCLRACTWRPGRLRPSRPCPVPTLPRPSRQQPLRRLGRCCARWGRPKHLPWLPRARLPLQLQLHCPAAGPSACPPRFDRQEALRRLPRPDPLLQESRLQAPERQPLRRPAPLRRPSRLLQSLPFPRRLRPSRPAAA